MQNDSVYTKANLFYCTVFSFLLHWNSYPQSCPAVWMSSILGNHGRCVDVHYMAHVVIDMAGLFIIVPISNFISFGLADTKTPCSCTDGNGNSAQEGSSDGASTPSIAPCLSVATTVLWVVPHLREQEDGIRSGNVTASQRIARGGGVKRADARWRQRNERQRNNQPARR